MARFGFVGPSYQSQSPFSDAEMCMNWYVEADESGAGKSAMSLYPTPGLAQFCLLESVGAVRGFAWTGSRLFASADSGFFEIFADGTFIQRGDLLDDGTPVSMVAGLTQILIASAGTAYVFNLGTNVLATLSDPANVSRVDFSDGFFIALIANSNQIRFSALEDASTWDPLAVADVSIVADNIVTMLVDHRDIWLWGPRRTVVYYDAGTAPVPFQPIAGGFIEQGCIAQDSPVRLDNSVFWVGADERGDGIVWRANGYTPVRVSNHAVEFALQGYPTIADAIGYSYQDQGHSFYQINFPSANATWTYDAATGLWHQRGYLNPATGNMEAHLSQNHVFAFGKHLVGDRRNGSVYQMSIALYDDAGSPIRRVRRAPYVSNEDEWIFHSQLQVDAQVGLGPQPPLTDGSGNPRGPQMMLRWSDDGAQTWSNQQVADCGQAGDYRKRVLWRRVGRSRARVYEVAVSDPIPWRITDAYLEATPGWQPTERLASQYRKVS